MMLKTNAHVLSMIPFHESSRIVVWLTEKYGKLGTMVKGSQRNRSLFLGQYDQFYTCEIIFYAREHKNLHILKECFPLQTRSSFRQDWKACAAASYLTVLMDRITPLGPPHPGLYELLQTGWDQLSDRTPGAAFLPYFEFQLLHALGLAPSLQACSSCRRQWSTEKPPTHVVMDVANGRILCPDCAPSSGGILLPLSAFSALQQMSHGRPETRLSERHFNLIRSVLGGLLEHHAVLPVEARQIAFDILRRTD